MVAGSRQWKTSCDDLAICEGVCRDCFSRRAVQWVLHGITCAMDRWELLVHNADSRCICSLPLEAFAAPPAPCPARVASPCFNRAFSSRSLAAC